MLSLLRVVCALAVLNLPTLSLLAASLPYDPPKETAAFKPGPGADVTQANCSLCHSADYISTQPQGPAFGKEFWQAEVSKMINVYGAPISPDDAKTIVEYLVTAYH